MSDPIVPGRDELYRGWLEWATTNLGGDNVLAGIAATAATDAAENGGGFNGAAEAARAAWAGAEQQAERARRTGAGLAQSALPPAAADASSSDLLWRFAGCIVAPLVLALILGVTMGLSSLGVSITEDQFAEGAALLPVAGVVAVILALLIRWYVRRSRRG